MSCSKKPIGSCKPIGRSKTSMHKQQKQKELEDEIDDHSN